MKLETMLMSFGIHLIIVFLIAALASLLADLLGYTIEPVACLAIGMAILLFVLYPLMYGAVRTAPKDKP